MWNSDRCRVILLYRDLKQPKSRTTTVKIDKEHKQEIHRITVNII